MKKSPYLLMIPQLAISLLFVAGIVNGLVQSLGVMPSLGLTEVSLQYYKELFAREDFISSLLFSVRIALLSSLLSVAIGVVFCAFFVRLRYTKGIPVRIVQLPIVVPHVVVAFFVIHFFAQNGLLARILFHLGMLDTQSSFPLLVFDRTGIGIILGYVWKEAPFILYFVLALMASVDETLGEAAINLGASSRKAFFRITLPLCMPTVAGGFLILFTFALGAYELPYILGATEPKVLPIWAYLQYTHPDLHNRPYAMAVNGLIVLLCVISVGFWAWIRRVYEKK